MVAALEPGTGDEDQRNERQKAYDPEESDLVPDWICPLLFHIRASYPNDTPIFSQTQKELTARLLFALPQFGDHLEVF